MMLQARRRALLAGLITAPLWGAWGTSARAAAGGYRTETVAEGLDHPWSLAFLPDGRALVTERAGRLRVLAPAADGRLRLQDAPVAGLPPVLARGQAGLFEVLPAPDFAASGRLLLSFAHGTLQANHLRVVSARLDGATLHDVTPMLTTAPAKAASQHFGGRMAWLPDGTVVVAMGDGNGDRTVAQRLDSHLGKLLRVHADGRVPADNPFVGQAGALPEIYSLGHRNPQGLVWAHGRLFAHEHGPRGGDELNLITPGANYGWPITTGGVDYTGARVSPFTERPGITPPLLEWTPSIAPAGMCVVAGGLFPAWEGALLVAALRERSVRLVRLRDGLPDGVQELLFTELGERLRDVRSGPDGAIWLLTDSPQGRVLRVVPA
jgi:glucose/arabinose dehydrogenase